MKNRDKKCFALAFCSIILCFSVFLVAKGGRAVKNQYFDKQVEAAQMMQDCMDAVKSYKQELGIPLFEGDYFATGMLGEEFNTITTSLGELTAKRTTADKDMAALVVKMFYEAGLKEGDKVGAGFSGSFPSMNIAVLCAAQAMGLEVVAITSVGASTYGANNPQLTFPEMLHKLHQDGLTSIDSKFVTLGGDYDTGVNMDPELLEDIAKRLEAIGISIYKEKDLEKNIAYRMESYGKINCFVAVGGNVTTAGTAQTAITLGQGVLDTDTSYGKIDKKSGLIQHYLAKDIPVINILNIKRIAASYGMPFDPVKQTEIGVGNIYFGVSYPKLAIAISLSITAIVLLYIKKKRW